MFNTSEFDKNTLVFFAIRRTASMLLPSSSSPYRSSLFPPAAEAGSPAGKSNKGISRNESFLLFQRRDRHRSAVDLLAKEDLG